MTFSRPNRSDATATRNRTPKSVSPFSGMCTTCRDGCEGFCEVGKSAVRGKEAIYPEPFGEVSSASEKDYPIDFSHFNILGSVVCARGGSPGCSPDVFQDINLERAIGRRGNLKVKLPVIIGAMGSTDIASRNWDGLAVGAAISGTVITIGENVCGMDPRAEFKNGRVVNSPELKRRVKLFQNWNDGFGTIAVQANIEDNIIGVHEYALDKLGIQAVELKWGQGAKSIGGEVQIKSLERALMLKRRGYIVLPDPEDPIVQEAYHQGAVAAFERHSRVGTVDEESFLRRVEQLRQAGARFVFLKTGAYRPADLARAVKYASDAQLDLLIVDGAGGGTGMSPWRMMNEWGIPTIWLESLLYRYLDSLADKGAYLPAVAMAGGFSLEDHVFKGLAMGAPYVKLIAMGRAPLAAAMVAKTIGHSIKQGKISSIYQRYGATKLQIFYCATELKQRFGKDFNRIPDGALGVYNYFERLKQGLRQLMCGARISNLDGIDRGSLVALTPEAARVSGIPYVMELDQDLSKNILGLTR
ncbi:FMN-binding glutamate synthase family protein [Desulfofundulus luciae]|nr:FMN-binding glutamate synthase family protein [Desulfofundulus luciae]